MRYVRRFNRADIFDIDGIQQWLEEMSGRGLHLVRLGSIFSTFKKGTPEKLRYRLEPERNGAWMAQMSPDLKTYYREMGWNYVCSAGSTLFHVLVCAAEDTPELYTDPDSLASAMKRLKKTALYNAVYNLLLIILLALASWLFWKDGISPKGIISNIALFAQIFSLLFLPFLLISLYHEYRFLWVYHQLKKNMPIPRSHPRHQTLALVTSVSLVIFAGIILLSAGYQHYAVKSTSYQSLNDIVIDVPMLYEIENRTEYTIDEFQDNYEYAFHPDQGTYYLTSSSILAPIQYTIVQSGGDPTVFWSEILPEYHFNMRYQSTLRLQLWETRSPGLAEKLLTEKINIPSSEKQIENLDIPGFDKAILHLHSATNDSDCIIVYYLFLQKENRAAYIRYYGAQDLREHLDLFCNLMESEWMMP